MKPFRAITRVGILALAGLIWMAFPAAAGPVVDPSTLQPPPPPGAECRADGQSIICHTSLVLTPVNEPVAELPCGTVYESSNDVRRGIRWYNSDGKLVKRFVTQDLEGTMEPVTHRRQPDRQAHRPRQLAQHVRRAGRRVLVGPTIFHGNGITVQAPGFGVIVHIAGLDLPDGTHHGVARIFEDPEVAAELCAALTG